MLSYIVLEGVFLLLVLLGALRIEMLMTLPWFVLAALPFAVFRAARTISYNAVMSWLRAPFCDVVADSSGAGDSVEPKPGSKVGELLACPICSGTWAAAVLVNVLLWWPAFGTVATLVLGAAGISELVHWFAEREEWTGRAARETAGRMNRESIRLSVQTVPPQERYEVREVGRTVPTLRRTPAQPASDQAGRVRQTGEQHQREVLVMSNHTPKRERFVTVTHRCPACNELMVSIGDDDKHAKKKLDHKIAAHECKEKETWKQLQLF